MILMSACLCGIDCKYNGKNNENEKCIELFKKGNVYLVCPEQLGGLKTPRNPAEIKDGKVVTKDGVDVSNEFFKGALETLKIAKLTGSKIAILKENSPSCGSSKIYNGNFTGEKIKGYGITTKMLIENGIKVFNENELEKL